MLRRNLQPLSPPMIRPDLRTDGRAFLVRPLRPCRLTGLREGKRLFSLADLPAGARTELIA